MKIRLTTRNILPIMAPRARRDHRPRPSLFRLDDYDLFLLRSVVDVPYSAPSARSSSLWIDAECDMRWHETDLSVESFEQVKKRFSSVGWNLPAFISAVWPL